MRVAIIFAVCFAFIGAAPSPRVREVGHVRTKTLNEASGLVASTQHADVYWTHNDGNDGVLYAIRGDGTFVGKSKVAAKFHDWEDIASDGQGRLYLADVGNNERSRKNISIYRIDEPDPGATEELRAVETFRLAFPAKPFNSESLLIHGKHGYLISKLPDGHRAELYRFVLEPSKKKQVVERVTTLPVDVQITAADFSADGKRLAVLNDSALFVFEVPDSLEKLTDATPKRYGIPAAKAEGCCFTPDGVLVIAESGEIFRVRID
jgi:hypothetical protein